MFIDNRFRGSIIYYFSSTYLLIFYIIKIMNINKFNILFRNASTSSSRVGSNIEMTPELKKQLESGLSELKQLNQPIGYSRWNEDGWANLRDDKLRERWELLRKFKNSDFSTENSLKMGENNKFNDILTNLFKNKTPSDIKIEDKDIKVLADNLNPVFSDFKQKLNNNLKSTSSLNTNTSINSNSSSDIIQIKDGKLIVDIEQTNEIMNKTIKLLLDTNPTNLVTGLSIGVGGGLLYRAVVMSYSKTLDSLLSNANTINMSDNSKKELIQILSDNKSKFNKSGGVLITIALYTMIQVFANKNPITFSMSSGNSSNNLDKMNINSFFSLIFKNKIPKWLQYIIVFIFCIINGYIFIKYINPYISNYISLLWIRKIVIFVIFLNILYYLYNVYFLINVSDSDLKIIDLLPKKIKNHINWLKNIKNSSVAKIYIQLYLTNAIYMFILLLIFMFITSLLGLSK